MPRTRRLTAAILPLLAALLAAAPPAGAQAFPGTPAAGSMYRATDLGKAEEVLRADEMLRLKQSRDAQALDEARRKLLDEARAADEAKALDAAADAERNLLLAPRAARDAQALKSGAILRGPDGKPILGPDGRPIPAPAAAGTRHLLGPDGRPILGPDGRPIEIPAEPVLLTPQEELFYNDLSAVDPTYTPERFRAEVRPFGHDLFARPQLFVAPARMPAAPDYRLGPDDGLLVHVWNATVDEIFPVEVSPEGRAILPKLGEKFVDGFALGELERHLTGEYGRIYANASVSVSLSKLKSVTVFVVGEVKNPGSYNLPGFSTALNALVAAGGPTAQGSLRGIAIKRVGAPDLPVDLYDFLLRGDRGNDRVLRSGDTLFVPVVGPQVLVHGPVRRPGLYEFLNAQTVDDALRMAGGLSAAGFRPTVRLMRTEQGRRRSLRDIALPSGAHAALRDGDLLLASPVFDLVENFVRIHGHVERPGRYQFVKGMRLLDLLGRGARLLPNAHLERAELVRHLGEGRDYDHAEDSVKRHVKTELIPVDLRKVFAGDKKANLELRPLDELNIFSWDDVRPKPRVQIAGAVMRPGSYDLKAGMRIQDLVYAAGNLTKDAMVGTCEVMRRVTVNLATNVYEERLLRPSLEKAMAGDPEHNLALENFDAVTILAIREQVLEKKVTISGEVRNPGTYLIRDGERLSSLLRRAGGFSAKAYPRGAIFTRESVKQKQAQGLKRSMDELKRKVSEVQAEVALRSEEEATAEDLRAIEEQKKRMGEFASFAPTGRMNIHLLPPAELEGTEHDILLVAGDRLAVPTIPDDVTVVGEVVNPGSVVFEEGRTLDHYIHLLGGYSGYADERRIFVVRADGTTLTRLSFGRNRNRFFLRHEPDLKRAVTSGSFSEMKIERGDVIQVPSRVITKKTSVKEIVELVYKVSLSYAGIKAAIDR